MSRRDPPSDTPLPPPGLPGGRCWCGGYYLDTVGGREAHDTVFGHEPQPKGAARDPTSEPGHDDDDEPKE